MPIYGNNTFQKGASVQCWTKETNAIVELYSVQFKVAKLNVTCCSALSILAHAINILKWPDSLKNFKTSGHWHQSKTTPPSLRTGPPAPYGSPSWPLTSTGRPPGFSNTTHSQHDLPWSGQKVCQTVLCSFLKTHTVSRRCDNFYETLQMHCNYMTSPKKVRYANLATEIWFLLNPQIFFNFWKCHYLWYFEYLFPAKHNVFTSYTTAPLNRN